MNPLPSPRLGPRIALLGLRGAGKTTVGALLSARLSLPWFDTDRWVTEHASPPAELITSGRLADLRRAECDAIVEFARAPSGVLSLGGGVVETPGALVPLEGWSVVLLDAPDEELARRIEGDPGSRPPLTSAGLLEEIVILRERRWTLYTAIDPIIIATEARPPESVVEVILDALDLGSR